MKGSLFKKKNHLMRRALSSIQSLAMCICYASYNTEIKLASYLKEKNPKSPVIKQHVGLPCLDRTFHFCSISTTPSIWFIQVHFN